MDDNDTTLAANSAELILLIDSSAYLDIQKLAHETGLDPFNLLNHYPNVDFYYADAVINELVRGREGLNVNTVNMFKKSLRDEMVGSFDGEKDARVLYNAKDGSTRVAILTAISAIDQSQILLCQNHDRLVLLTNDHKMQKNAAAVLDNRLMDVQKLLELMSDTPDQKIAKIWQDLLAYYKANFGYKRPKTVRTISDRKPGLKPPHLRD